MVKVVLRERFIYGLCKIMTCLDDEYLVMRIKAIVSIKFKHDSVMQDNNKIEALRSINLKQNR